MQLKDFESCLALGKLLDQNGLPLREVPIESETDTFFHAAGIGLCMDPIRLRSSCVLHFIKCVFDIPQGPLTVKQFLEQHSNAPLLAKYYRAPCIRVWARRKRLNLKVPTSIQKEAVNFVALNNQVGYISCRFTFGYIISELYQARVQYYDYIEDVLHVQPVINVSDDELAQNNAALYICFMAKRYRVFVPVKTCHTRTKALFNRMEPLYVLRMSDKLRRNTPLGTFTPPAAPDHAVHICHIKQRDLHLDAVYQIYPAAADAYKLTIETGQTLFVYAICENEASPKPYCTSIVQIAHDIVYPYFMLKPDTQSLLVLIAKDKEEALQRIAIELNV